MDAIKEMFNVDFSYVLTSILVILAGIKAISSIGGWAFDILTKKLGLETKQMRKKKEAEQLLKNTSKSLQDLQKRYDDHIDSSEKHILELKNDLTNLMKDVSKNMNTLKEHQVEIEKLVEDISNSNKARDNATIEEMCDRISSKIRYYINTLHGIPEDEYDDFVRLFDAYEKIGGNHGVKAKYEYCIKHLDVLPIKTEIESIDETEERR